MSAEDKMDGFASYDGWKSTDPGQHPAKRFEPTPQFREYLASLKARTRDDELAAWQERALLAERKCQRMQERQRDEWKRVAAAVRDARKYDEKHIKKLVRRIRELGGEP